MALEQHVLASFQQGQDCAFLILANDKIHFPVSEALAVCLLRPFMNGDPVWYHGSSGGLIWFILMVTVLHSVVAVFSKFTGIVRPYLLVYPLPGYVQALVFQVTRYLFR